MVPPYGGFHSVAPREGLQWDATWSTCREKLNATRHNNASKNSSDKYRSQNHVLWNVFRFVCKFMHSHYTYGKPDCSQAIHMESPIALPPAHACLHIIMEAPLPAIDMIHLQICTNIQMYIYMYTHTRILIVISGWPHRQATTT